MLLCAWRPLSTGVVTSRESLLMAQLLRNRSKYIEFLSKESEHAESWYEELLVMKAKAPFARSFILQAIFT
jgi:hypothetical protein